MDAISFFCPECGEPFTTENPRAVKFCPNCGKRILLAFPSSESPKPEEQPKQEKQPEETQEAKSTKRKKASTETSRSKEDKPRSLSQAEFKAITNRYIKVIVLLSIACALLSASVILALIGLKLEVVAVLSGVVLLSAIYLTIKFHLETREVFTESWQSITTANGKTSGKVKIATDSIISGLTTYDVANRVLRHSGFKNVYIVPMTESECVVKQSANTVYKITANGKRCTVNKNEFYDSNTIFVIYYYRPYVPPAPQETTAACAPSASPATSTAKVSASDDSAKKKPDNTDKQKKKKKSDWDQQYDGMVFGSLFSGFGGFGGHDDHDDHDCDCDDHCDSSCDCDCHDDFDFNDD